MPYYRRDWLPDRPLLVRWDFTEPLAAGLMSYAQRDAAFDEFVRACSRLLYTGATTELPPDRPEGSYVTCRVVSNIPGQPEVLGWSPFVLHRTGHLNGGLYNRCVVSARWRGDAVELGSVGAHEAVGHALAPDGTQHSPSGLFRQEGGIQGLDFLQSDIDLRNAFAYPLAIGSRTGDYRDTYGDGQLHTGPYQMIEVDPNWRLPVWGDGCLMFPPGGPVPPCLYHPPGWGMWVADPAGYGQLFFDFGRRLIFHPGPDGGKPKADPVFQFAPGVVPMPAYAPDRGGAVCGWQVRHKMAPGLVIDPANRIVGVPT